MRKICVIASLLLMGCATSSPPRVSDFNGDSVKVSVYCGIAMECAKPRPEDNAQAEKTCATRGREAQYSSTTFRTEATGNLATDVAQHLYICV